MIARKGTKMVTQAALVLLALPALYLCAPPRSHVMPIQPRNACPAPMCLCSAGEVSTGQPQRQMAICTSIPNTRIPKTISALTVHGNLGAVVKSKMTNLGYDLQVLDMCDCGIRTIQPGSFDLLTQLTKLKLSNNQIVRIEPRTFAKNAMLNELHLDGNRVMHFEPSVFAKMDSLQILNLGRNSLTYIPAKIPRGLTHLDLCNNNIGPKIDTTELREIKLKELNLCGNHIDELTVTNLKDIANVEKLCLGSTATRLPGNSSTYLRHIASLSLRGRIPTNTVLNSETQQAITDMKMLTTLNIINYKIDSVAFLHALTNMVHLQLENIITTDPVDFQPSFYTNKYLNYINFDNSPTLAQNFVNNIEQLHHLTNLESLHLRHTGIKHVAHFALPNKYFKIDISKNPLVCDCGFAWLQTNETINAEHLLLCVNETLCQTPGEFNNHLLTHIVTNLKCMQEPPKVNEETTTTEGSHIQVDSHADNEHGQEQTTIKQETIREETQQNQEGIISQQETNGEEEQQSQGGTNNQQETNGEEEQQSQEGTNNQQETNGEEEQQNQEGTINQQETNEEEQQNQEVTNNQQESNVEEQTQGTTAPEDTTALPEENEAAGSESSIHNPNTHKRMEEDDENGALYIVLLTIVIILIVIGVILGIVYWHFKKKAHNKVEPETDVPQPTEPTYKQLQQATEDTSLIKGVKK